MRMNVVAQIFVLRLHAVQFSFAQVVDHLYLLQAIANECLKDEDKGVVEDHDSHRHERRRRRFEPWIGMDDKEALHILLKAQARYEIHGDHDKRGNGPQQQQATLQESEQIIVQQPR